MPESSDLAGFVLTDDRETDGLSLLPPAHAIVIINCMVHLHFSVDVL